MFFCASSQVKEDSWHAGVDLYNAYVWRGTKFGAGPSIQPTINYSVSGFTVGAWGAYSSSHVEGEDIFIETDLYSSYLVKIGNKSTILLTLTDYYFPSTTTDYFHSEHHCIEPATTISVGDISVMGAYMVKTKEKYCELTYNFAEVSIFAGAGDGMYTKDGNFNLCNVGVKTTKLIKLSDSFSFPVIASIVLNPSTETFNIVVGFSLYK